MSDIRVLKRITKNPVKHFIRSKLDYVIRKIKAPRMVWGYQNSNGEWRPRTRISDTVYFNHPENIFIEDNVFVGHYSILDGTGGLEIGEGCQIAGWNGLYTHSSHIAIRIYGKYYQDVPEAQKVGFKIATIRFGKYVFVGAGAKIFSGVSVGDGALIRAGTIVTKDVGEFEIVSGNPSEVIGDTRKLDKRYLKDPQLMEWYNEWQKK